MRGAARSPDQEMEDHGGDRGGGGGRGRADAIALMPDGGTERLWWWQQRGVSPLHKQGKVRSGA